MAKNIKDLSKSLRDNLDLTAYSQVGHTHQYAGSDTVGGSATSAVKLATARAINGTNFDGTAAITTAKWGTARTLTIGNSGKSVDGSGNISWTLAEIGAAASGHTHSAIVMNNCSNKDLNTIKTAGWYYGYTGMTNAPVQNISVLEVIVYSPDWIVQRFTAISATGITFERHYHSGTTWSAWKTLYDSNNKPTPADIGAAASSHGTHVDYATTAPKANGTAAVGSSSKVAREDHVHPLQTTVSGNAGSADKLTTARTITIGNKSNTFDGSANITYTLSEIGAAATSHTHNYAGSSSAGGAANSFANNLKIQLNGGSTEGTNLFTYNGSGAKSINITPSSIGAAASSHGTHVSYSTTTPKVAGTGAVGSESSVARGDHVHPAQTTVSGNAGSATKLQTARNINGTAFDGTANITTAQWGNARNIYISDSDGTNTGAAVSVNGSANATLKLPGTIKATLSGNASTATKLAAARTINGTNFDGSANITTANWGTSRKINQVSVNGSEDVKLPLDYYTCTIGSTNTKPYHHILTTGQCTGSYTDKAITIVITQHYNGGGLGIARAVLRTNDTNNGAAAIGELKWLVRLGFNESQLCYNLRSTVKDAYMDVFFKCNGTYGSVTWYVLTEGSRGNHNSQWTKQTTHHDNGTHVYDETGMKAIRTYTSTLVEAEDAGFAERSNNAYYADDAGTAAKWKTARTLTIGNKGQTVDGSGNVTWSLTDIGAAAASHTHNYAGSSSAGGAANSVANSLSIQLNGGTATTFNGSAAKSINITPSSIGAATSSHGTHVTYSTSTPLVAGTGAVGTASNVARGDHVHPAQTSVTGNAGTATKLATARTITIGSTGKTFDGSANVSWTAAEMGVLPMTGNTGAYSMTGNIEFASAANGTFRGVVGKCGVNDYWRVVGNATADNAGYMEIATADDGTEPIYVRQYTGAYATVTRTLTLLDGSGNTSMPGNLSVSKGVSAQDITASGNVTVTGTVKVGSVTMKYNDTSESLDFVFA